MNSDEPVSVTVLAQSHRAGTRILAQSSNSNYQIRQATSLQDIQAAQTLRFFVFNLEMQEGLENSYHTMRDEDPFDAICQHLLVECNGEVVGTYRMQTGTDASANLGFYSGQEFDLSPFAPQNAQILELGRACVHKDHRNLHVLSLLWKGIATYARQTGCRYLLGCSSITSQNPVEGLALYNQLSTRYLAPPEWRTKPLPAFECSEQNKEELPQTRIKPPKLLSAYLSLGAKICAPPALDREFKSIDFLTLLDLENLHPTTAALLS